LWLELLKEDCNIQSENLKELLTEANELIAIFVTMSKKVKERVKRKAEGRNLKPEDYQLLIIRLLSDLLQYVALLMFCDTDCIGYSVIRLNSFLHRFQEFIHRKARTGDEASQCSVCYLRMIRHGQC